ncbi:agmatine deiminase family protein [Clostridioides sp. ZZV14-5902]|uniref:agmatine deiminase family protein n=1 Tax=Clostridioides sp. ZZV14-5902 TaxID=2811486 RepID=UPI0039BD6C03
MKELEYKDSYLNYYIRNKAALVPVYDDENDGVALEIISELYPKRKIAPIKVNSLFQY